MSKRTLGVKKSWHIYDGQNSGSVVTINNRIVSADSPFKKFVGQLLSTLPRSWGVSMKGS